MKPFLSLSLGVPLTLALCGCALPNEDRAPEIITNFSESRPYMEERELRVRVSFKVGHVLVSAAPETTLFSVDVDYDSVRYEPEISYDAATERLDFDLRTLGRSRRTIDLGFGGGLDSDTIKNRLNIRISPRVALDLELDGGVGETRIDLTGLQTRALDLESGVSRTFISCDAPNPLRCDRVRLRSGVGKFDAIQLGNLNFRRLDFEGGVGASSLEFSGDWQNDAEVAVNMGVGELELTLPPQLGAQVDSRKRFLSGLHLESFEKRGAAYFSRNYDDAPHRVRFRLRTGIGSIRVTRL